ncbi:hypothetical protein [Azospirillum largimobile]
MQARTAAPDDRIGRTPGPDVIQQAACHATLFVIEQPEWRNATPPGCPSADSVAKCVPKGMAGATYSAN